MRRRGSVPRTKIIIAMSKRAGGILRGWGEGRNVTHVAIIPGLPPLKRGAILSRVGPAFYISGSKNLPWQSNPFHTPSTGCIPYAYPVQLQQLVTEPRQGSLPCILHASLHVLVVHITWSRIGMAKHAFLITLSLLLLPFSRCLSPPLSLSLSRFTPLLSPVFFVSFPLSRTGSPFLILPPSLSLFLSCSTSVSIPRSTAFSRSRFPSATTYQ